MSKPTCAAMTSFDKHKKYLSTLTKRIVYLEEKQEGLDTLGMNSGYIFGELAAMKHARELQLAEVVANAWSVIETSQDGHEKEVCQKFLDKWG